jgi:hypothetical protein
MGLVSRYGPTVSHTSSTPLNFEELNVTYNGVNFPVTDIRGDCVVRVVPGMEIGSWEEIVVSWDACVVSNLGWRLNAVDSWCWKNCTCVRNSHFILCIPQLNTLGS